MQQNAQNGFQRVVTPQGQMPQFQQAQPAMTGYNPYQYIIPQNYPDISFQQQHIKAKQPQNSRMPPFSKVDMPSSSLIWPVAYSIFSSIKPPSGMSTAGAGDKTQIQKMPQANNGELFSGQEYVYFSLRYLFPANFCRYTSLHDIKQSPNISTPISNESNPVLSQGAQGIFPCMQNESYMLSLSRMLRFCDKKTV